MSSVDENVKENDLLKSLSFRMPTIPLAFLGLGVYRAWIEIGFVGSFVPYPDAGFATHDLFDMALAAMLLIWAALSRRTGPFFQKRWLFALCCATMTLSTCAMFCSLWLPGHALLLEAAGALLGGVGTSVMILMWSELYGCLNPLRVALVFQPEPLGLRLRLPVLQREHNAHRERGILHLGHPRPHRRRVGGMCIMRSIVLPRCSFRRALLFLCKS